METILSSKTNNTAGAVVWSASIILLVFLALLLSLILPVTNHWTNIFHPSAQALISGKTPYIVGHGFFNPPWVLIPIVPLMAFPSIIGNDIMALASVVAITYLSLRFGAKWYEAVLLAMLPQTLFLLFYINIDWMVPLGLLFPPAFGLFLVMSKPQIGIGVAIYWLVESWRCGGVAKTIKTFAPIAIITMLSFLFYGPWIMRSDILDKPWNWSLWPWSIPFGVAILMISITKRQPRLSLLAGPLLSPYIAFYSWPFVILGMLPNRKLFYLGIMALWTAFLFKGQPDIIHLFSLIKP